MKIYVPLLKPKNDDIQVTQNMELAAAFLYFELDKSESLKNIFTKQLKKTTWIARGLYPLKAKLYSNEDKSFCVYDSMGIAGEIIIDRNVDLEVSIDAEKINMMDIRSRIDEVKKIADVVNLNNKQKIDAGCLLYGYEDIGSILRGEVESGSILNDISVNFDSYSNYDHNDVALIKDILSRIQQSVEDGIKLMKELCTIYDVGYKNSITESERIYDQYKDKIYQAHKEISNTIAKLAMEREDKIQELGKIYFDKNVYVTQDCISNKNKYDIAKIYGNEIEMGIYQRGISDAEDKQKQLIKESVDEVKKVEKHYDNLLEDEKKKLNKAIVERDEKIKECRGLYLNLNSVIDEAKKVLGEDICKRRAQIKTIMEGFAKFGYSDECDEIDIYIPFYIAQYSGDNMKYKLFYPMELSEKGQIVSLFSGITGKIPMPFAERHKLFFKLFEKFKVYLEDEQNSHIIKSLSNSNLMNEEETSGMVEDGLKALLNAGYLSDKNYEKVSQAIKSILCSNTSGV